MNKKKIKQSIYIIVALVALILIFVITKIFTNPSELKSIRSYKQLETFYENESDVPEWTKMFLSPFYLFSGMFHYSSPINLAQRVDTFETTTFNTADMKGEESFSSKDFSTTNIQVENVDEADITKTDGDYIYSISETNVVITDVREPENIKVAAKIEQGREIPEELILYQNQLVIISSFEDNNQLASYSYYNGHSNSTVVSVYDIADKEHPQLQKSYTLYEPYNTSRCIEGKLYVFASGSLRKDDDDNIVAYYIEDNRKCEMSLKDIQYLKDVKTDQQTLISCLDLQNPVSKVDVKSYLMDISNCYVSQNAIYLLDQDYENDHFPIAKIFGWKGIFGLADYENDFSYQTQIYKFNILENGAVRYVAKTKVDGKTINQFSLDEYKDYLRVALYDEKGSRVVTFNQDLKQLGKSDYVAKGEQMYSSRFLGDKAYFVTYRTTDPLYVVDVSVPEKPTILGELKIPGYSTYLHPYDENHLIGIGMQTKEQVIRNASGRGSSTVATIIGMKMALFDVSDVNHPVQISDTVIGDSRTTSAILTNHKALLFSKERELLAIPVNNYAEDFEVQAKADSYTNVIQAYDSRAKNYISEGYFVYHLNIADGFQLKGIINHDKTKAKYSYNNNSKLLRGLYIDQNLFTVSETAIKVNRLENLELIKELKLNN